MEGNLGEHSQKGMEDPDVSSLHGCSPGLLPLQPPRKSARCTRA